jgi:PEP-CTERM motif-containing protein
MKSLHKKFGVLVVAAAMAAGVAGNAQASILAQSVLEITNFRFLNPDGTPVNVGEFSSLNFQDSSQIFASLNGTNKGNTVNSSSFGTLDNPQQCVGNCGGFLENDYSHRNAPATINVARGDSLLNGAPILSGGAATFPADAHVVAEGQLSSTLGNGNVQANLGLTATVTFVANVSEMVTIAMSSNSHVIAAIQAGDKGTARASDQWIIDIEQNNANGTSTQVFNWAPNGAPGGITGGVETLDQCNLQQTLSTQVPGVTAVYDCVGNHSAITGVLVAGQSYTLSLRHTDNADVTRIPEPGTLLLLGLGLAGLGFSVRRRKSAV